MSAQSFRRWLGLTSAGAMILAVLPVAAASAASSSKTVTESASKKMVVTLVAKKVATAKLAVPAQHPWTDTHIHLSAGDDIGLKASGTVNVKGGIPQYTETPTGDGPSNPTCVASPSVSSGHWIANGLPCWSLIGRIGDGKPFFVGDAYLSVAKKPGELYLGVNDELGYFGDNSGSWTVQAILAAPIPRPNGSVVERFVKWLNACLDGRLPKTDPGCKQAAYDLADLGHNPGNIVSCAADLPDILGLVVCLGEKGAYAVYEIWQWWWTHVKRGP